MSTATVDHAYGKVTLTLPFNDGEHAFLASMSPDEARNLASALTARAHAAETWTKLTAEEADVSAATNVALATTQHAPNCAVHTSRTYPPAPCDCGYEQPIIQHPTAAAQSPVDGEAAAARYNATQPVQYRGGLT